MSTNALRDAANAPRGGAVATIIDILRSDKVKKGLQGVATRYLTHERMLRLAVNAVARTPNLQRCNPQSVLGAIMTSTALGLEPNTVEGQAYLIPYKRRAQVDGNWIDVYDCQFQIGYRGYITLAHRLPGLTKFQSEAIHDGDRFEHQLGTETFLRYAKALKDRGELIGAFCYSEISGGEAATILPLDEILKIRGRSETHKVLQTREREARTAFERAGENPSKQILRDFDQAVAKLADTPWELWEDDMAAKSAIKKHCKKLPKAMGAEGSALGIAAEIDGDSAKLIDIGAMADPDMAKAVVDGEEPIPQGNEAVTHEPGEKLDLPINTKEREKVPANEQKAQEQAPLKAVDTSDLGGMNVE